MTGFDFSPLYRTSVGFDRLASLLASANRTEQGNSYPPYNIVALDEDTYQITMAVAGFTEDELNITSERNKLLVTGEKNSEESELNYLYRGIAARSFERRFNLADHVRVTGASTENGLLHIHLEREVPEAMKPRTIAIQKATGRLLDATESKTSEAA